MRLDRLTRTARVLVSARVLFSASMLLCPLALVLLPVARVAAQGAPTPSSPAPGSAASPSDPAAKGASGRVGTLSPDEARRAARARERAVAGERAAPAPAKEAGKRGTPPPRITAAAPRMPSTARGKAKTASAAAKRPTRLRVAAQNRPAPAPRLRRRSLARLDAARNRRAVVDARSPQVGDVVLPGVPLYPVPAGVRYGAGGPGFYAGYLQPQPRYPFSPLSFFAPYSLPTVAGRDVDE